MKSLSDITNLDSNAKTRHFKKGSILLEKDHISSQAFYVKKGLLRSYIIDSKGKEHIFMFASEGWIIADIESQEFAQASDLYIDCLEDSEIVIFDRNCLILSDANSEMFVKHFKLLYRRMGVLQRRVLMLMSSPAIDRYEYFLETYPGLPNRIPQHMIASYLGITPQALSTLRGKITRSS